MNMVRPWGIILVVLDTSESNGGSSVEGVTHHHPLVVSIESCERGWIFVRITARLPFGVREVPQTIRLMLPIFHIRPSTDVLEIVGRTTFEHHMLSVRINKLVGELPNISDSISHARYGIASWAVCSNLFWFEQVNTFALIPRAWRWNSGKVCWPIDIFTPWESSVVVSLSSILPFVLMRKTLSLSLAE